MTPFDSAWFAASIVILAPLLLAAIGEIVSQRSGVLNIGLEGYMLTGAFAGLWAAYSANGSVLLGLLVAALAGMALAGLMALISIRFEADQVVAGVGINLLALGLTGYLVDQASAEYYIGPADPISIPVLSSLPFVGKALFVQHPATYGAFTMLAATWWCLYRTKFGILIRACGDYPSAADSAGHNVKRVRTIAVLFSGMTAGLAGALISVVDVGTYQNDMINGRGFLVLAAVVLGRWSPVGALFAVALFAGMDAFQLRLQALGQTPASLWLLMTPLFGWLANRSFKSGAAMVAAAMGALSAAMLLLLVTQPELIIPFQFWRAFPFIVTLVVLGVFRASTAEPKYLTVPFTR